MSAKKRIDGLFEEKIGECVYETSDNVWNIIHTEVDNTYQGQGIARKLVECIIENAKKEIKPWQIEEF